MESPVRRLGLAPASSAVPAERRVAFVLRREVLRHDTHLTWTLDDVPLGEHLTVRDQDSSALATPLDHDSLDSRLGVNQLRTLLDEAPDPDWGTTTRDGRVVVAYCPRCFGLSCPVLSTRLVVAGDSVWWRDVGWQLAHDPFCAEAAEFSARFERAAYESLLERLLVREQVRLRGAR